jgi:D-alanyl-D-alanine carboxypeptidase (penicillin-binding protein 5/6)
MKGLIVRRGRLYPALVFLVALALIIGTTVGVARGTSSTTISTTASTTGSSASTGSRQESLGFTVSASDLGDFSNSPPTIKSPSAIVINMTTGKVIYEHNAHTIRPMASTTKIMTATLVLERMSLTDQVVVSANAVNTPEPVPFLKVGDVFTVEQLLYAMLLRSANSAAVALAEACAGTVDDFAALMNQKAAELGMNDTHFVNPNGLDASGHHSTAADMAILARYAMQNAEFRKIVSTETYKLPLPGRGTLTCTNTDQLLGKYDWVTGIKTGLTPKAEQCFVGAGTKDGVNIISVILGQPSTSLCFSESKALLLYGFSQYRFVDLLDKGTVVAEAEVPYHLDGLLQLVTADSLQMELYKTETVTVSPVIDRPLTLPVQKGDVFGKVTLTVDGSEVGSVDLVAAQSFEETRLGRKVAYFWGRLGRAIGKIL